MRNGILILICLVVFSCKKVDEISHFQIRVNHFKQTAIGVDKTLVFLVQEEEKIGSDSWTFLYSNIDGFEYQLGYIYDLLVVKKANQNPSADGSSERYELVKVVSKIEVDEMTGFRIKLKSASKVDPSSFVFGDLLTGFSLLGEIPIDCDTLCEELFEALGKENEVVGQFVHQGLDSIRLTEIVLQ